MASESTIQLTMSDSFAELEATQPHLLLPIASLPTQSPPPPDLQLQTSHMEIQIFSLYSHLRQPVGPLPRNTERGLC